MNQGHELLRGALDETSRLNVDALEKRGYAYNERNQ
jgi:hypothetical protein